MMPSRRLHRLRTALVDRILLRPAGSLSRRWLTSRIQHDARLRSHFDRSCVALRVLEAREDDEWSSAEAALCEASVLQQLGLGAPQEVGEAPDSARPSWLRNLAIAGGLSLAAAVLLLLGPWRGVVREAAFETSGPSVSMRDAVNSSPWLEGFPEHGSLYWGSRGRRADAGLAIDALCGEPLRSVSEGCTLRDDLTLTYRIVDTRLEDAVLVWFAVDEEGKVLYYQPTPVDLAPVRARSGSWQALPFALALGVQHELGSLRIYALAYGGKRVISVEDVDRWAAALLEMRGADGRRAPIPIAWHLAIGDALGLDCDEQEPCASAQSVMTIGLSLPDEHSPSELLRVP